MFSETAFGRPNGQRSSVFSRQQGEPLAQLIQIFAKFPGLGPRSARRLVLHFLKNRGSVLEPLIEALRNVAETIVTCSDCGLVDTCDPCQICANPGRDPRSVCVVETVQDAWAIERANIFKGRYHVIGGTLSALEGRGPDAIATPQLLMRIKNFCVSEIILALNPTIEGQITSHFLAKTLSMNGVRVTQLAQGLPIGGELDYLDEGTLSLAFQGRHSLDA